MTQKTSGLSKSILQMKFMKRTKEKVDKEKDEAEGRAMYSSQITEKMLQGDLNYIFESSYVPCEDLIDGRMSFRGVNPEIERLMELESNAKPVKREMATDVSDTDMVHYYSNVVETMNKKFQPPMKKKRFMKPSEDWMKCIFYKLNGQK